jgi:SPP1 gp7 family putative phage head morphogenesis protein
MVSNVKSYHAVAHADCGCANHHHRHRPVALIENKKVFNAVNRERNKWVSYCDQTDREIDALLGAVSDRIVQEIERQTVDGKVPPAGLPRILGVAKQELATMRPRLVAKVKAGMRQSVKFGFDTGVAATAPVVKGNRKADVMSTAKWKLTIDRAMTDLLRILPKKKDIFEARQYFRVRDWEVVSERGSGYGKVVTIREATPTPGAQSLSDRVWDLSNGVEKLIRTRVSNAVVTGDSAAQLSRDVRAFLNEPDRLYRRVRNGAGNLVPSRAARLYTPGAGVYRSAYKNAMRLSRTEMTRAFTEGTKRYGAMKSWVTGYIWRASGGDEACDECASYDGNYYAKDDSDMPELPVHPHCFCYLETVTDEDSPDETGN